MNVAKYTNSAGGVVLNKNGEILVVRQRNNVWSLPKGHVKLGEQSLLAAKREIFEESGVSQLALIKNLGKYKRFKIGLYDKDDKSEIKVINMYLFTTEEEKLNPVDDEHEETLWLDKSDAVEKLTHEKDKEFLSMILNEIKT